jgi:hypothetical protein
MRSSILLFLCFFVITGCAGAQTLRGVVDIHAHSGPDSVPRSIDSLSLAKVANQRGFRGLVLKNHYEPTAALAGLARRQEPGLAIFGGIALNLTVGGINAAAVERMTRVEGGFGKIVWMPTFDAENQVRFSKENRPFVIISREGRLLPEVSKVLDIIARHDLVLATGHSSPAEDILLIEEARRRGVKRIVVTHALLDPVRMPLSEAKRAAQMGAYIEFVGNAVVGVSKSMKFEDYASAMREIGFDRVILSSDFGQPGNPIHPDGLEQVFAGLRKAGVSEADIEKMAKQNPARLLGLE